MIFTDEEIEALSEMRYNCEHANKYDDPKRQIKAKALYKALAVANTSRALTPTEITKRTTKAELLNIINEQEAKIIRLSQWDVNKDTRNSRQRVTNSKLTKQVNTLQSRLDKVVSFSVAMLKSLSKLSDIVDDQKVVDTYFWFTNTEKFARVFSAMNIHRNKDGLFYFDDGTFIDI